MRQIISNRIIVIGGNHINTLSVIRCLGECNCNIHVLIHANQSSNELSCANSRFSKGKSTVVPKTEEGIIQWLLKERVKEKQIIFPCSDFAAYVIDENADVLSEYYYIPGFINNSKMVCDLMGKWNQKQFANRFGIRMAKSWRIDTKCEKVHLPSDLIYPCIIKPNKSAFGMKSDITVCEDEKQLLNILNALKNHYPQGLLIQEYVIKDEEYDCMGCVLNDKKSIVCNTIKKIFDLGGNTVYAKFTDNPSISKVNDVVINSLYDMGYRGMFDIEYILSNGKVYLIEINFRHCGVGFGAIKNKVYAPFLWCADICKVKGVAGFKRKITSERFLMDETVCFNHRKEFGLSLMKWIGLCLRKCCFAKFDIHDLRGTFFLYKQMLHRR